MQHRIVYQDSQELIAVFTGDAIPRRGERLSLALFDGYGNTYTLLCEVVDVRWVCEGFDLRKTDVGGQPDSMRASVYVVQR